MSTESPDSSSESPDSSSQSNKYNQPAPPPWAPAPAKPQPIDQSDVDRFLKGNPVKEKMDEFPNPSKNKYK